MQEKRKHKRIDAVWVLRLHHRLGGNTQSRTVNVSGSGMLFLSSQGYRIGEYLAVEIDVSPGSTLRAVVRITREIPGTSRSYTYGAEFVEFADNGRQLLEETLATIWQRQPIPAKPEPPSDMPPSRGSKPAFPPAPPAPERVNPERWGPTFEESPDALSRRSLF